MSWENQIKKSTIEKEEDPKLLKEMAEQIKDACQDIINNVKDGSDYREFTLEKILFFVQDASEVALNEY